MERQLWPVLYSVLRATAKGFHHKHVQIPDWVLIAVLLWAALHDRPIYWACNKRHWSTTTRKPLRLPSPATMSRRAYGIGVALLWRLVEQRLRESDNPQLASLLDENLCL